MKPFLQGYAAEMAGYGFLDNPHPTYSTQARQWVDGYVMSIIDTREFDRDEEDDLL